MNSRIFGTTTGSASVEAAIKKEFPGLPKKIETTIYREKVDPLPKFKRLADPEAIYKLNKANDAQEPKND